MDHTLDSSSPVPLHHQLRAYLEDQISSGSWKAGDRVPSESEIGERFQISRTTVRQALGDLVNQGLLTRIQGKGTFVAQPRIQQYLAQLTSFTQDMRLRQRKPSSRVLQLGVVSSSAAVAQALQLQAGEPVIILKRVRMADDQPMAVEISYLPYLPFSRLVTEDMTNRSLYETLKNQFNIVATRALQQIEAIACPPEESKTLNIRKGSPVLHIYRTTFNQEGKPFENVESFYRSDSYIFHVEIWSK